MCLIDSSCLGSFGSSICTVLELCVALGGSENERKRRGLAAGTRPGQSGLTRDVGTDPQLVPRESQRVYIVTLLQPYGRTDANRAGWRVSTQYGLTF